MNSCTITQQALPAVEANSTVSDHYRFQTIFGAKSQGSGTNKTNLHFYDNEVVCGLDTEQWAKHSTEG